MCLPSSWGLSGLASVGPFESAAAWRKEPEIRSRPTRPTRMLEGLRSMTVAPLSKQCEASHQAHALNLIVGNENWYRSFAAGDIFPDQFGKLNPVDRFADAIVTAQSQAVQKEVVT